MDYNNKTTKASGSRFQLNFGHLPVVNPADNTLYQFWPRANIGLQTVPLFMWEPTRPMVITDFEILKECNGVNGTLELSEWRLIRRVKVNDVEYKNLVISNRYMLHNRLIFNNTVEMSQSAHNLSIPIYHDSYYAIEWLTPIWVTNPTNIYLEWTFEGYYL